MAAYQGASAFKVSDIIDKEIKVKDIESSKLEIKNCDINFNNVNFKYSSTGKGY